MKKALKAMLFILISLSAGNTLLAQMTRDDSKWTFEAKKKTGSNYELSIHLSLPEKWHIYSLKPGGDGMEMAPEFSFGKNSLVNLIGHVTEKGKLIREKMEGIDGI